MMDRLWVKVLLYPTVAMGAFFICLWLALPMDKVQTIVQGQLETMMGHKYNVSFTTFELSGVSGVVATDVEITSKPPPPNLSEEEKAKIKRVAMTIDRIEIDVALLKALVGKVEADFEVQLSSGVIEGTYQQVAYEPVEPKTPARRARPPRRPPRGKAAKDAKKKGEEDGEKKDEDEEGDDGPKQAMGHQVNATFEEIPLNAISVIRSTIGLPLTGAINGDFNVFIGQASELLDGQINLKVNRTALGPGQLPPDVAMGFKLENVVRIGDINIDAHVEKGKLLIDSVASTGPDMVFQSNGNINLKQPFTLSRARVNARFKLDDAFLKNNKLQGILDLDPKIRNSKAGEWYGILLDGPLNKLNHRFSSSPASKLERIKPN